MSQNKVTSAPIITEATAEILLRIPAILLRQGSPPFIFYDKLPLMCITNIYLAPTT